MSWGSNENLNKDNDNWCSGNKKDEKTDEKVRLKNARIVTSL